MANLVARALAEKSNPGQVFLDDGQALRAGIIPFEQGSSGRDHGIIELVVSAPPITAHKQTSGYSREDEDEYERNEGPF